MKITQDLITRAHNSFLVHNRLAPGKLFSRAELRALARHGYCDRRMYRNQGGTYFWLYEAADKLWKAPEE